MYILMLASIRRTTYTDPLQRRVSVITSPRWHFQKYTPVLLALARLVDELVDAGRATNGSVCVAFAGPCVP